MEYRTSQSLSGCKDAADSLQALVDSMQSGGTEGLAEVSLELLNEAVQRAPETPEGLRSSGYVELDGTPFVRGVESGPGVVTTGMVPENATQAEIGFHALSAAGSHEQAGGNGAKFLESVMVENTDQILRTIAENVWKEVDDA